MVDLHYLPDYVSFAGVDVTEGEAAASGVWGGFGTARRNLSHLRLHRLCKGL